MDGGGVRRPAVRGGHTGTAEALPLVPDGLSHAAAANKFLSAAVNVDTHTASLPQWFEPMCASGGAGLSLAVARSFPACGPPVFFHCRPILGAQIQADGPSAFLLKLSFP